MEHARAGKASSSRTTASIATAAEVKEVPARRPSLPGSGAACTSLLALVHTGASRRMGWSTRGQRCGRWWGIRAGWGWPSSWCSRSAWRWDAVEAAHTARTVWTTPAAATPAMRRPRPTAHPGERCQARAAELCSPASKPAEQITRW